LPRGRPPLSCLLCDFHGGQHRTQTP
jgi:hypothetical protein